MIAVRTVGIIGSGNVGANIAFMLAERGFAGHILLCDARDGIAAGKALDMSEASPVRAYNCVVQGADLNRLSHADIIVLAAGMPREVDKSGKPTRARADLLVRNAALVGEIAGRLRGFGGVVIVATEPVDRLTLLFRHVSGMERSRVLGVGTLLDSQRLRALITAELEVATASVSALVIGSHDRSMIVLPDCVTIAGIPVGQLITSDRLDDIIAHLRSSGDELLIMGGSTSAYYAAAAAAADLIEAVAGGLGRLLPVSLELQGEYGIDGVALSLPAIISSAGAVRIIEPRLDTTQKLALKNSATHLQKQRPEKSEAVGPEVIGRDT